MDIFLPGCQFSACVTKKMVCNPPDTIQCLIFAKRHQSHRPMDSEPNDITLLSIAHFFAQWALVCMTDKQKWIEVNFWASVAGKFHTHPILDLCALSGSKKVKMMEIPTESVKQTNLVWVLTQSFSFWCQKCQLLMFGDGQPWLCVWWMVT